ncbi:DUF305 domain-containing protein [Streptomyces coeruleoprunus]|uniref:DUF305 domain-containing protein n=1 Tax=Streptomyces coeruleoprunus TaxID=285563 RepID=A0ABV9XIU6_9ACTN
MTHGRTGGRGAGRTAAAVLLAVLTLAACESEPSSSAAKPQVGVGASGSVLAPGKPGEPARTLSPEEAASALPDDSPNPADFSYTRMMIVHHQQALRMTALAPKQAASEQVRNLAARIDAAQRPEIDAMRGWLKIHGDKKPSDGHGTGHGHSDHGSGTMPGMATEAQLTQLAAARGEAFDELFLQLMITHHQGALVMAGDVLGQGRNNQVQEMANDVIAQQTAEINRMRSM